MPRPLHLARREAWACYLFISPWLAGFLIFMAGPLATSLGLSFTQYDIVNPARFVGVANYVELFGARLFWQSLKVTVYFTALSVPLGMLVAFALALLLNQRIPFRGVFRTIYYLPAMTPLVALALLWQWLLNPEFGLVNYFIFQVFGVRGPGWFFSPDWVIPAFVMTTLWGVGQTMIIYLAGIQGVPTELYEAAEIDGAGAWHKLRHVTLPMVSPVILFTLVIGIIGSFQVFTQIFVITGGQGGPNYSSLVYVLYLYQNAFRHFRMGFASAQAWILFLIILALTLWLLRTARHWVHYEGAADR